MKICSNDGRAFRMCLLGGFDVVGREGAESWSGGFAKQISDAKVDLLCRRDAPDLIRQIAKALRENGGFVTSVGSNSLQNSSPTLLEADAFLLIDDLYECKMKIFELSDGFVVLPGGIKDLDQLMEYTTWMQRVHGEKPVIIVNVDGYWNDLFNVFDQMSLYAFLPEGFSRKFVVLDDVSLVIQNLLKNACGQIWLDDVEN